MKLQSSANDELYLYTNYIIDEHNTKINSSDSK